LSSAAEYLIRYQTRVWRVGQDAHTEDFDAIAERLAKATRMGKTVFTIGNGGSAATADHFATDLMPRGIKAMSLTNPAQGTRIGNDNGFDHVFERQLEVMAEMHDVLVAFSVSGDSVNVLNALRWGMRHGLNTIAFLGNSGGAATQYCDLSVSSDHLDYPAVEDLHSQMCHALVTYLYHEVADA